MPAVKKGWLVPRLPWAGLRVRGGIRTRNVAFIKKWQQSYEVFIATLMIARGSMNGRWHDGAGHHRIWI